MKKTSFRSCALGAFTVFILATSGNATNNPAKPEASKTAIQVKPVEMQPGSITGTVEPAAPYSIFLYGTDGRLAALVTADANGAFTIPSVEAGIYKLAVAKSTDPSEPPLHSMVVSVEENTTTHLSIRL